MRRNAFAVIIGLFGTIALSKTMSFNGEKTAYTNSMTAFLLVLFSVILLHHVYAHITWQDTRGKIIAAIYSVGLAFSQTAGKQLQTVENFAAGNSILWIQILLLAAYFFGFVLYVFQWLRVKCDSGTVAGEITQPGSEKTWSDFLITWFVIFLCWIPVFLAFYPGAFVYDAQDEYVQVASRVFTTHHPLTHVLLLGGCVCFGNKFFDSYNVGIAIYTIFQMVLLSGVFAYTVSYFRTKLSKKVCTGMVLFYGLFPVIPMYAVCSAKDTLFNAAFLLMLVQMLKLLENASVKTDASQETGNGKKAKSQWGDVVLFVLASSAMMLFRNNGVMAYGALLLVMVVVAAITFRKNKFFTRFAVMMVVALVLYGCVDKTLAFVLQADDSENQEILTVPIQQLARTYKYSPEVFSKEDRELLFSYIPEDVLAVYDADLSDLLKANFNNEKYAEKPSDFMRLWVSAFTKKPVTYLNAWFMTSYGYWYPDTVINVYGGQQRFTFQYGDSSYFGFETELPGERDGKFPWLEEQYRRMSLELYQQNVPGISMLFSPGFMFWIFFASLLFCVYRKNYSRLIPLGIIFLLWGTAILGPTFLVRYVLILWFALPVILCPGADHSPAGLWNGNQL